MYERLVRPVLFRADAEWIHDRSIRFAERIGASERVRNALARHYRTENPLLHTRLGNLELATPIGLAAGYDKSGRAINTLSCLGFGHVEIGSVSADPSAGNPKPRLWRLPGEEAIVVYYGLPNDGADRVAQRLACRHPSVPVGVNVVNTNRRREEPDDVILADYVTTVRTLHDHADYLCLNLSCPNTRDGRGFFHDPHRLKTLLEQMTVTKPLFLKIAPGTDLDSLVSTVEGFPKVTGFSINLPPGNATDLPGAVAGRPAEKRANETIRALYPSGYPIIGSGGVFTAEDAYRKIRLGASAVQLLTSLVYRGPSIAKQLNEGLAKLLARDGLTAVTAVGTS